MGEIITTDILSVNSIETELKQKFVKFEYLGEGCIINDIVLLLVMAGFEYDNSSLFKPNHTLEIVYKSGNKIYMQLKDGYVCFGWI